MSKTILLLCFSLLTYRGTLSQCIRPSPRYNIPLEAIIEATIFPPTATLIAEQPGRNMVTIPATAGTTIITDCTPSVCQNLANTLQLMIVANLLQNTQGGSDLALKLTSPIVNDLLSNPTLSCGCPNPVYPGPISPNLLAQLTSLPNLPRSVVSSPTPCNRGLPANVLSPNILPNFNGVVGFAPPTNNIALLQLLGPAGI